MKVVINACYGGFHPSDRAIALYAQRKGVAEVRYYDIPRDDADLIAVVEELGDAASHEVSSLLVVEIPDGIEWQIEEYDGFEHIAEKHRTWP